VGIAVRLDFFEGWGESFSTAVRWAGHIDPHLILYVFLPTLIFEAAFAMDVHTFKKSVGNALILAVPGIITALFLTAFLIIGIKELGVGLPDWTWQIALLFGVVISATDPVAVVSLLKELGASKKLGTLIEGESLLNDGTAIVIFLVILGGIQGASPDMGELQMFVFNLHPVFKFAYISFGGIILGLTIGGITIRWVRSVFNDAIVEISAIVTAAYITFYIAEHFLYVSGVLGLVALGLAAASVGRTRISPQVEHFLHEFWELLAFMANTLIFIIVGVVIAEQTVFTLNDFLILIIIYIGIHIVRAIVVAIFYPFMRKTGYGLDKKNAVVVWYGALRGAIGLALALIVAGIDPELLPETVQNQFLFFTAGIVFMTLLINAVTIKFLIRKLGLTKLSPAKAQMIYNSQSYLRKTSVGFIDKLKHDRFLNHSNWSAVKKYLPKAPTVSRSDIGDVELIAEIRRRVLEQEKSSYWMQFKQGLLGPTSVQKLSEGINQILDSGGLIPLSDRKDLEDSWKTPGFLKKMQKVSWLEKMTQRLFFERLAVSYDSARGFVEAQEDALKLVESMHREADTEDNEEKEKVLELIEEEINTNRIHGLTYLRNLRKSYPEIYNAISTRQAIRSLLNYEMQSVERLYKKGRLETEEAQKLKQEVEERMKRLVHSPPSVKLPKNIKLLKDMEWFDEVEIGMLKKVSAAFTPGVFSVGETIIKENENGNAIYVIVRGTVKVTYDSETVVILGPGSVVGEIAALTGQTSEAGVVAESPVTVLRMRYLKLQRFLSEDKFLYENLWKIAARRIAENTLSKTEPYKRMKGRKLKHTIEKGEVLHFEKDHFLKLENKVGVLIVGMAFKDGKLNESPLIIDDPEVQLVGESYVFVF
jgi:NhaP-type Na+/H+ or K+/H+ antiporter/CRP-like cAMP-binding protein